ncbi:MAG: ATP-binding protein [Pseudomonadota bacterium]
MRFRERILAKALSLGVATLEQARSTLDGWRKRLRTEGNRPSAPSGSPDECLQTIIDSFAEEVIVIGPDFRIHRANGAVLRRLGDGVVGQTCFSTRGLSSPCRPPWCECPLHLVVDTGQTVRVVHSNRESEGVGERWVEIAAAPVRDSGGRVTEVIELTRDVSESKRLQRELLRANRELLALNYIGRALSESLDLKPVLQTVAETMLDALDAPLSWVRLDDGKLPILHASRGLAEDVVAGLMEAANSARAGEISVPGGSWRLAATLLKSKGAALGTAGIAATLPLDESRVQLLDAIGSQIAVAVERCRLYQEVQLARDMRGELLHSIITTQEEERRRIARELHDRTGQALTALRLSLERLALAPATTPDGIKAQLAQPLQLCQQADEDLDRLIYDLRPALIDDLGLVEAIKSHVASRLGNAGIAVSFRITGEERRLPGETEVALFRVTQEAITNIIKHAGASGVVICLQFKKNRLVAEIEDDGSGFETTAAPLSARHGLGLLGMRERLSLIGGTLSVTSSPGAGTRLKAVVPLAEERVRV